MTRPTAWSWPHPAGVMEIEPRMVQPELLVLRCATAGKAALGPSFRVGRERGADIAHTDLAPHVVATTQPLRSCAATTAPCSRRSGSRSSMTSGPWQCFSELTR